MLDAISCLFYCVTFGPTNKLFSLYSGRSIFSCRASARGSSMNRFYSFRVISIFLNIIKLYLPESCRILFFVAEISSNLSFLIVRIVNSILGIEIRKNKIVKFLIRDCHKGKIGIVKLSRVCQFSRRLED